MAWREIFARRARPIKIQIQLQTAQNQHSKKTTYELLILAHTSGIA